jgi:hypothetical protein
MMTLTWLIQNDRDLDMDFGICCFLLLRLPLLNVEHIVVLFWKAHDVRVECTIMYTHTHTHTRRETNVQVESPS